MNLLANYTLVYEITSLPHVIFCNATPACYTYDLSKIEIPSELRGSLFDCRFIIFDKKGEWVDYQYKLANASTVKTLANTIPLEMVKKLKADLEG